MFSTLFKKYIHTVNHRDFTNVFAEMFSQSSAADLLYVEKVNQTCYELYQKVKKVTSVYVSLLHKHETSIPFAHAQDSMISKPFPHVDSFDNNVKKIKKMW